MSDNTELTFIRCPSCRSLVPALSTRCRMCGASLDKAAAPAKPAAKAEAPKAKQAAAPIEEETDPLADYLSELEADSAVEESIPEEAPAAKQSDDTSGDDDEEALNELEKLLEELKSAEEGVDEELPEEPELEPEPPKPAPVAKKPVPQKPVQIAKEEDIDESVDEFSDADEVSEDFNEEEEPVVAKPKPKPVSNGYKKPPEITTRPAAPLRSKPASPVIAPAKPAAVKAAPVAKVAISRPAVSSTKVSQQSLVGWFVIYTDAGASSMELRSGRYFITRNKIKGHDILIDDESISTPHAMLILDSESGVQIQDLLSEEGVYVRRAAAQDYEQVEDLEVLENGDWVRFGNVEYLLVLVPAGAR